MLTYAVNVSLMASVNLVNIFTCLCLRICETGTWCVTNWIIIIIFKNYFQIFYPERISQDLKKNTKRASTLVSALIWMINKQKTVMQVIIIIIIIIIIQVFESA